MATGDAFVTIRSVGGLLPADVLGRVAAGTDLPGLAPGDYHLGAGESLRAGANRSWQYLLGTWSAFRDALAAAPAEHAQAGLTREKWLLVLLRELGYGRVPVTPAGGITVDGKAFPVSHQWEDVPVHLLGWGTDLDTRSKGVAGAAGAAPQAMVQELLNRSEAHLWAIVSNGRVLRLLRDSSSLVGQAYVEFDLEAMFDGEVFSDFVVLWLTLHQSRLERLDADGTAGVCWLERWRTTAAEEGTRALDRLRGGVTTALESLGTGFWTHPDNADLRARLAAGEVSLADYQRALLRLVYRLLFAFVAEDRGALLDPDAPPQVKARYSDYFSTARLRRLATKRRGGGHDDLYTALTMVFDGLGREGGLPPLGLPGLGGLFESTALDAPLAGARLSNRALLAAVRALSVVQPKAGGPKRVVDYRNLGAEELGSVYESLLELVPRLDADARAYRLEGAAGNDRKTSGSYYTPTALVDLVLDTALDPLLDEAVKADDPEAALLAVTVLDPAMGSAHFLVGAARRVAKRLAAVRTGDAEPAPGPVAQAMHDVVARCLFGVDLNPMAVELAKVSLWLEALQPGRPLSFLDAHLKVGNALLGVTPRLLADGLPDEAFAALTGDDKAWTTALRKRNRAERESAGQGELFGIGGLDAGNAALAGALGAVDAAAAGSLADEHARAARYAALQADPDYARARRVADAWCAAFVQPKTKGAPGITHATLEELQNDPDAVAPDVVALVDDLATRHRFFHWHLEFPQLFRVGGSGEVDPDTGWTGGVACLLGNPPWERIKLQEQEFFATRDPDVANAPKASDRKKAIANLKTENPSLYTEFQAALRQAEGESHLIRTSGRYPLTGRGDVNTYGVFAEAMGDLVRSDGLQGLVCPTGIATDLTTSPFIASYLRQRRVLALHDFITNPRIWGDIAHGKFRFCVLVLTGGAAVESPVFSFMNRHPDDLLIAGSAFHIAASDIARVNPNTGTIPAFGSARAAQLAISAYRRFPILISDDASSGNPWMLRFRRMFDLTNDARRFLTMEELQQRGAESDGWRWVAGPHEWVPLVEAKLIGLWDHRLATYADRPAGSRDTELPRISDPDHDDPFVEARPRYWVSGSDTPASDSPEYGPWYLGWRDITGSGVFRTLVCSALPRTAVANSLPVATSERTERLVLLQVIWSSFVFDFMARQKITGAHLNFFTVAQLPCPTPNDLEAIPRWSDASLGSLLRPRAAELANTSWRMYAYARDADEGRAPFRWDPARRELIRAELDAFVLHLYDIDRADAAYILDSFGVLRRSEERDHGEFRSKRLILEYYDALAEAAATGVPYRTPIDPPPGDGPRHDESTRPTWAAKR